MNLNKLLIQPSLLGLLLGLLALSGCGRLVPDVYRIDVNQGNVVTQDMVNQLKIGMTPSQVRYVMGTPLLIDVFHDRRWDYVYRQRAGFEKATQKRMSLYFEKDKLSRIEGDFTPQETDEIKGDKVSQSVIVPKQEKKPQGWFKSLFGDLFSGDDDSGRDSSGGGHGGGGGKHRH